jgi:hypothetical protein
MISSYFVNLFYQLNVAVIVQIFSELALPLKNVERRARLGSLEMDVG